MEIKEPKFKVGDKVRDLEDGDIYTVIEINRYSFSGNEYWYDLEVDKKEYYIYTRPESKLEPCNEPPKTVWDLKDGDEFFFITAFGNVFSRTWDGSYCTLRNMETGSVFLTKEEAKFECERRKIETEMLRLGGRRKFKYNGPNYCISYNDGLCIESYPCTFNQGGIYFDSVKEAMEVVKTIGDDRIKKYIFGVEE